MQLNADIIVEHIDELGFLWQLRELAVEAPHYRLRELAALDERIEAHLDALRVHEDQGWTAIRATLADSGAEADAFAAGVLASEAAAGGDDARFNSLLTLAATSPAVRRGMSAALGWLAIERARPLLQRLQVSPVPSVRRLAIAACARHGFDPGPVLAEACADPDAELRARALRAVGELGRGDLLASCRRALGDSDPAARAAAAWSAVLVAADAHALAALRGVAETPGSWQLRALRLAARCLASDERAAWLRRLSQQPTTLRLAVLVAGASGDPALVPWLIEQMRLVDLARVAGEGFASITGVDLAAAGLAARPPLESAAGPSDDPAAAEVALDADEHLPWPDAERIASWWAAHGAALTPGVRHVMGRPVAADGLRQVLRSGTQRQRAGAALDLALCEPGHPLFEVRAPAARQLAAGLCSAPR